MEKIQSANSRLFAPTNQNNHTDMNGDENQATNVDNTDKSHTNKELLQPKHRVTFSSDVEEYDDDIVSCADDVQYKDDEEIDREVDEIIESNKMSSSIENDKMDGLMKFMTIQEDICPDDDGSVSDDENEYPIQLKDINDIIDLNECHGTAAKSKPKIDRIQSNTQETIKLKNDTNAHKAIKKSEIIIPTNKVNDNISPCRACAKNETLTIQQSTYKRPTSSKPNGVKRYEKDFNRSKNRIVSASASSSNRNIDPSNDLFKIHLNVRTCCENKYLDNNRLPRYNGYNSQYGLSKDQMEQRKLNRQKYMEQRTRRNREILKAKEEIACLNEQAFRQWLIRKNHLSRSKYKNMYDFSNETFNL